jgi:LmbE family N-acetylglucosaminyl deacetylase
MGNNFKKILFLLLSTIGLFFTSTTILAQSITLHDTITLEQSQISLTKEDRIMILAPHPDDEIIACAGIIQRAKSMQLPVQVVYLTYGDNNEWAFLVSRKHLVVMPQAVRNMGLLRHNEGVAACKSLGLNSSDLFFLGYPDFATMGIWHKRWDNRPPIKSMLTRASSVPYSNAFRPGAPYKGEEIVKDLQTCIKNFRPTKIFVSHPGDHSGDHMALYLFSQIAIWNLEKELRPQVYPYIVHFVDWPKPQGFRPHDTLTPPALFKNQISWQSFILTPQETQKKLDALKLYNGQFISSANYLMSFIKSNELFGDFPPIKLHQEKSAESAAVYADKDIIQQIPDELTSEERSAFIGFEERTVRLENNNLVITINLSRPLGKTVGLSVYAFGYRHDKDFEKMPKIQISVGTMTRKVYDRGIKIPRPDIKVTRQFKTVTLTIPLKMLDNPEKILLGARTYLGNIPLDWLSWRILEIPVNYF